MGGLEAWCRIAVGSLAIVASHGVRTCEKVNCARAAPNTVIEFSCGGAGEVIKSVNFASFGQPDGTCPEALLETPFSNLSFTETEGCSADNSLEVIEACVGEEECSLDLSGLFSLDQAGLESCGVGSLEDLSYLVHLECEDAFDPFALISLLIIAFIGVAVGATVDFELFHYVFRHYKRGVVIGWLAQFGIMPLLAFALIKIFSFSPNIAIGVMIAGSSPGGATSNLITYWAHGNVALSVVMSAASTICAVFMLPLLTVFYLEVALGFESEVTVSAVDIIQTLMVLVIPAIIGAFIRSKNKAAAIKLEKFGSGFGGVFLIGALALGINDNPDLLNISQFRDIWISAIVFQPIGALFGYGVAKLAKLPMREVRAVSLETGLQNFLLAIAVVSTSVTGCRRVEVLSFPLIGALCYFVHCIWMAIFLRYLARFDPEDEKLLREGSFDDQLSVPEELPMKRNSKRARVASTALSTKSDEAESVLNDDENNDEKSNEQIPESL